MQSGTAVICYLSNYCRELLQKNVLSFVTSQCRAVSPEGQDHAHEDLR